MLERRLAPGSKNGPRHFTWFKTVVADYFQKKRDREMVTNPSNIGQDQGKVDGLTKEQFDSMTEALELKRF